MTNPLTFEEMTDRMTLSVMDGIKTGQPLSRTVAGIVANSALWGSENRVRYERGLMHADCGLNAPENCDIGRSDSLRHGREVAKFRVVLYLMGVDADATNEASAKMADAMCQFPSGSLVMTHGPMDLSGRSSDSHVTTFHNLVAMWWQDDDDGSQFNELLWDRGSS